MSWEEAKQHADYVREHGIDQFLKIWHRLKDRTGDVLLWGDEVSLNFFGFTRLPWSEMLEREEEDGRVLRCDNGPAVGQEGTTRRRELTRVAADILIIVLDGLD